MAFDESILIKKEDMIVKKEDTIIKEDIIVERVGYWPGIYREKISPYIDTFKTSIEYGNGKTEIRMKDIRGMLGYEEFKNKSDTVIYSMIKLILIESGIKVRLHHHYGANVVLSFASEEETRPSIEITRERMAKTAKNAGYENYADYLINTPYHRSRWNITNKEDNRFFVVIGKKFIAPILFPGAVVDDHSYINRYMEHSGYDWTTSDGIKIKHIASTLQHRVEESFLERDFFQWFINENDVPDIFVLTGWENGDELELMRGWIFDKNEYVNGRKFWDRKSFLISSHDRSINKYSKFEIDNDKLNTIRKKIRDAQQISTICEYSEFVDYRIEIAEWYKTYFRYMG